MNPLSIFFPILLISAASAQTAAGSPEQATELGEVVITANKSPSLTAPSLEERKEQLARTVPGGVAVVDAEDYKRGRVSTLKDALDFAPGVLIQSRFGAEESRLSIRGSGIQRTFHGRGIWLMQDGMPLNLSDGSFDMQAVEPLSSNHVEVHRGANALQYGATTLGGAVNFISQTGHTASRFQARHEIGSFNTRRAQISSGFVSGDMDVYASISAAQTDGFRDYSGQESLRVSANIGTKLSPNLENRFYLTWVDSQSQLPGALTKAQMEANAQQANAVSVAGRQRRDYQLLRLANRLAYSDGDNTLALSLFWSWKDLDHPIFQVIDQLSNDLGFDLRYDGHSRLLGLDHDLTAGLGFMYGSTEDNRFANVGGARGAPLAVNRTQSMNLSLYFQDQLHLMDTLSFIAGSSVVYANRDLNEEVIFGPDNTDRQEFWGFSPKLGLLWDITPKSQVYFNASRSFEPPSFGELTAIGAGFPSLVALKPQTATTLEFGTRGETERAAWDFSYYYAWLDDEMLTLGVPGNATLTSNAGRTIHQGIEFSLNADLWRNLATASQDNYDRLVLRQNFLWNHFSFDDSAAFGDRLLPGIPPYYYRAELLYEHPCGFYFDPNLEWSPHRFAADLARTTFADPYALLGLKLGFKTRKGVSVFIEARNLTDATHSPTTGVVQNARAPGAGAVFFPGDGRAFYAGVEFKW